MELLILLVYGFFLVFIFLYSLIQLQLVFLYWKKKEVAVPDPVPPSEWPLVTIQLPIYNERYVVERLIKTVVKIEYPKDKFEIQILDDSTDETSQIIDQVVKDLIPSGVQINIFRRKNRKGYKAGALAEGTRVAIGEFMAIFDADFLPPVDFLKNTIPYFQKASVGVVQTRWRHINERYSLLTQIQAFGLDAHFSIEQSGRNAGGHFINFNGTAGIWRRQCIDDAGGWSADTLTEDLDLSYRAQLKGWQFQYLEKVGSPAELPVAMDALKNQQFRWTKGAAECTRKNLFKVLKATHLPLSTKVHAIFHLMNSFIFICVLSMAILSLPLFYIKHQFPEYDLVFTYASGFVICLFILMLFYGVSFKNHPSGKKQSVKEFAWKFPLFLSVSMGMSLHNGIAVLEGLIGKKSPFVRTPKFDLTQSSDKWYKNKYLTEGISLLTYVEGLFFLYFVIGALVSIYYANYAMLPFFIMLSVGYGFIVYYSIKHAFQKRRPRKKIKSQQPDRPESSELSEDRLRKFQM